MNAAGPWVAQMLASCRRPRRPRSMCAWSRAPTSWCRGCSTTIVPTCSRTRTAASYSRFRISGAYTLIGTTDRDFAGDPAAVAATPEEIAYLCDAGLRLFRPAGRAGRCGVEFFRGPPAPRRPRPRPRRGDARLCAGTRRRARTAPRCCRCSAARSPPTGASPRRRSTGWRRICRAGAASRRLDRPCAAARRRFRRRRIGGARRRARGRIQVPDARPCRPAGGCLWHAGERYSRRRPRARRSRCLVRGDAHRKPRCAT